MPTNHTQNYRLSQWVKSDQVKMEDFNADNAKIDAALKAEADARTGAVSALSGQIAQKAEQSALAAEVNTRVSQVNAINSTLGGKGNCRIWTTSYVGDGTMSRTVTFPAKPLMVFVMGENIFMRYIRGVEYAMCSTSGEGGAACFATWEGNALTWYYTLETSYMCNRRNETHYVVALIDMDEG